MQPSPSPSTACGLLPGVLSSSPHGEALTSCELENAKPEGGRDALLPCAGMCRAHGIAHQRVSERGDLRGALAAAWSLNRHSVVEVVTPPGAANVAHHRALQAGVRRAVLRALRAVSPAAGGPRTCTPAQPCHAYFIQPAPVTICLESCI